MSSKVVPMLLSVTLGLVSAADAAVVRLKCGESVEGSFAERGQQDGYKASFNVNDIFEVTVEPAGEVLEISELVVLDPDDKPMAWRHRDQALHYESKRLSATGEYTIVVKGSTVGEYVLNLQCFSGDEELGDSESGSALGNELRPVQQGGGDDPINSLKADGNREIEEVGSGLIDALGDRSKQLVDGLFSGKEKREQRSLDLEEKQVVAALYDKKNQKGPRDLFYRDDSDLSDSPLGDRADSVWVAPGCVVQLYSEPDFEGRQLILKESFDDLKGTALGANSVSSIKVACAAE